MLEQIELEYSEVAHSMTTASIPRKTVAHLDLALKGTYDALLKDLPEPFGTILIDPPWRFSNRTGKMAPEH